MKRLASFIMIFSLVMLCACGKESGDTGIAASTVDMSALCKTMLEADSSLPDMSTVLSSDEDAESLFAYITDELEYSRVEQYLLSYSSEGKADEIVVIAVKDTADIDAAVAALNAHKQHRISMFEQYDPDNVTKVENGIVFKNAQYAVLIIADNASDIKAAFEKTIQ